MRIGVDLAGAPLTIAENTALPVAASAGVATRPLMKPSFGKGGQSAAAAVPRNAMAISPAQTFNFLLTTDSPPRPTDSLRLKLGRRILVKERTTERDRRMKGRS